MLIISSMMTAGPRGGVLIRLLAVAETVKPVKVMESVKIVMARSCQKLSTLKGQLKYQPSLIMSR